MRLDLDAPGPLLPPRWPVRREGDARLVVEVENDHGRALSLRAWLLDPQTRQPIVSARWTGRGPEPSGDFFDVGAGRYILLVEEAAQRLGSRFGLQPAELTYGRFETAIDFVGQSDRTIRVRLPLRAGLCLRVDDPLYPEVPGSDWLQPGTGAREPSFGRSVAIWLESQDRRQEFVLPGPLEQAQMRLDRQGRFLVNHDLHPGPLPPGTWTLVARHRDGREAREEITLEPGGHYTVRLQLPGRLPDPAQGR